MPVADKEHHQHSRHVALGVTITDTQLQPLSHLVICNVNC